MWCENPPNGNEFQNRGIVTEMWCLEPTNGADITPKDLCGGKWPC
jgi:hypothetical protein